MPRSISYHEYLIQSLKDPIEAAMYIEVTIEEGDPQMLRKAIANVVESQSRTGKLSDRAQLLYQECDRMLSEKKAEEIYCLNALLNELGFQLAVTAKEMQASGEIGNGYSGDAL